MCLCRCLLIHCTWHSVPFNLEIITLQFELFLYYSKKLFFSVFHVLLFLFFGFWPPGLILSCFTISVLCSIFWEFSPTSILLFYDYVFTLQELFCCSEWFIFPFNSILLFHGFKNRIFLKRDCLPALSLLTLNFLFPTWSSSLLNCLFLLVLVPLSYNRKLFYVWPWTVGLYVKMGIE